MGRRVALAKIDALNLSSVAKADPVVANARFRHRGKVEQKAIDIGFRPREYTCWNRCSPRAVRVYRGSSTRPMTSKFSTYFWLTFQATRHGA